MKNLLPFSMTAVITFIIAVFAIILSSCTTDTDAVLNSADVVTERIDMVFDGDLSDAFFLQSTESDESIDLVDYNVSGASNEVDFILTLDDSRELVFNVRDEGPAFWEQSGTAFSMYASQDEEDKVSFVSASLYTSGEAPAYISHSGTDFPRGTHVNVFRIVEYNPANGEILCRVVDFPLAQNGDAENLVMINGTFRGSISGLN